MTLVILCVHIFCVFIYLLLLMFSADEYFAKELEKNKLNSIRITEENYSPTDSVSGMRLHVAPYLIPNEHLLMSDEEGLWSSSHDVDFLPVIEHAPSAIAMAQPSSASVELVQPSGSKVEVAELEVAEPAALKTNVAAKASITESVPVVVKPTEINKQTTSRKPEVLTKKGALLILKNRARSKNLNSF